MIFSPPAALRREGAGAVSGLYFSEPLRQSRV